MNCTTFRAAVADAIERRERPAADVASHLDGCRDDACRACWHDASLLDRAIAEWRCACPTIDVADAVLARWQSDRQGVDGVPVQSTITAARRNPAGRPAGAGATRQSRVPRAAAAVAAAALVLFSVALLLPPGDRPHSPLATRNGEGLPTEQRRPQGAGDAGAEYVAYAQNAAQIVTDAVVLTLGDSAEMEDSTISPIRFGWDAQWPPMGEGMDAALDDLLDSLPAESPPS